MQQQIDAVNCEFLRGKEELELARKAADTAQGTYRALLEANEFVEAPDEDQDMEASGELFDSEFQDDPAVQAGKRSYLHALTEAKKRRNAEAEAAAANAGEFADLVPPAVAPPGAAADGAGPAGEATPAKDLSAAASAFAGAVGGAQTAEAVAAIKIVAEGLSRVAAKPMARPSPARTSPYAKSG